MDIEYSRPLENSANVVYEIVEYLGISPNDDQISKAIGRVDAGLRDVAVS